MKHRKLTQAAMDKQGSDGTPMRGQIFPPRNAEATRKVLAEIEDASKRALQAAVCIPSDEPRHQIAHDHSEAKRRADVFGRQGKVSDGVPEELANMWHDSTDRFAQSAQLFLQAWADRTAQALDQRMEQSRANPQLMQDARAKWDASAKGDPDRAELLEARIMLARLTMEETAEGSPPSRTTMEHVRAVLHGARREHRESTAAGRHPHVLLLEQLLVEGLTMIVEGRSN